MKIDVHKKKRHAWFSCETSHSSGPRALLALILFLILITAWSMNAPSDSLVLSTLPNFGVDVPYSSLPVSPHDMVTRNIQRYASYRYRPPMPRARSSVPSSDCGQSPEFEDYFAQSDRFRSSREEDKTLYHLFFDNMPMNTENLTYVELGAFNGIRESNTRFMDQCLGWSGLLIEANPMKYNKLLEVRPHAHCLQVAPSCSSPTQIAFHSVGFTNAAQDNVPNEYDNSTLVQVPCDRFTPILQDILGGYVTLVSLDVEGAEDQVLATVDFDQIHVDMWMVENVNNLCPRESDCPSRSRSRNILFGAGYVGYVDVIMGSDLFVFPNSTYDQVLSERFGNEKRLVEETGK